MKNFLQNFWNDEQGQDLIEYTLLLAFVVIPPNTYRYGPITAHAAKPRGVARSFLPLSLLPAPSPSRRRPRLRNSSSGPAAVA